MTSQEIRKVFLNFFKEREHKIVSSSPLLSDDPSVLFTTAGMQQFKPYFLEKESPYGSRVTSVQKCVRTSDIEEVGDSDHLTFMEMLGNFSFGDYFKEKAIKWALEFLIEECGLKEERIWVTVFEGDDEIPKDKEATSIFKRFGVSEERISECGRDENFWGPTGKEGPCGPTAELHYELDEESCGKGKECKPNCECGRFVEVWNLVFNQYYEDEEGNLSSLDRKGIDTGMGLERLAMISQKEKTVYETDVFNPLIEEISGLTSKLYSGNERAYRIITDHIKASVFLAQEEVFPSNVEEGYILRRLLRRAIRFKKLLRVEDEKFLIDLAKKTIEIYKEPYPKLNSKQNEILTVIQKEEEKFEKALDRGLKKLNDLLKDKKKEVIEGEEAFDLYQSYGFPLELTEELVQEKGFSVDKEGFKKAMKEHKEISRAGAEKKFSGVGIDKLEEEEKKIKVKKLHTATHLLNQALREILGEHVKQKGSDITPKRLRFDFSHPKKLTDKEIKRVERLVNEKIKQDLEVKKEKMDYDKAIRKGALSLPDADYPTEVTVYSIVDSSGEVFSKELCTGPHVSHTGLLGKFKITKEQSSSAGVRRIKAKLVDKEE